MARVTVEDCAEVVPSRFKLVAIAAQRARIIGSGGELTIERNNDKDAVIALREIAEGTVQPEVLQDILVRNCQEKVSLDEYGVEGAVVAKEVEQEASDEVKEELDVMQESTAVLDTSSDEELLYGDDNLEGVED